MVAALTAAAIATVGFLAYQASANASDALGKPSGTPSASASASASGAAAQPRKDSRALPADSGSGERVVYSLRDRRVWLVDEDGRQERSFAVVPSTISPETGSYLVSSRSGSITGSDGVRIEHVVRFANVNEVAIGFSAAVDGTMSAPDPSLKTGGVRMKRADGNALWTFATVGTKVVVV
ncbi:MULTISPECIES: L,D-transpeptidase [unclassified Streptomyces]|uniref:L,D-transpeptidase n=1 Tax=unclassified Streptomyces TaxID=2593676 RepID=UPI002E2AB692|nr:L,D-transpeptidase [Streptomyces sp. NBC_01429]